MGLVCDLFCYNTNDIIFFSFYIDDMRVKKYFAPHL